MNLLLAQQAEFSGIDGFLGTRGSIMLDVVFLAMFAIVPLLALSLYLVRYKHLYGLHKKMQLGLGILLLVAVGLFEIDMQVFTKWEERAAPSPYFGSGKWTGIVGQSLIIHLCFAVPTTLLWIAVIVRALRNFASSAAPGPHSGSHMLWGRLAGIGMFLTALTGWIFYWLAFVA